MDVRLCDLCPDDPKPAVAYLETPREKVDYCKDCLKDAFVIGMVEHINTLKKTSHTVSIDDHVKLLDMIKHWESEVRLSLQRLG